MKYTTFRGILFGAVGAAALGVIALGVSCMGKSKGATSEGQAATTATGPAMTATTPSMTASTHLPVGTTTATSTSAPSATLAKDGKEHFPLRPMDRVVLERANRPMTGDKEKDAFSAPYKVSFFREGSATKPNRAKIDLNRNEKWDEKWTFEDDAGKLKVKRSVAPKDDEQYSEEFRLVGDEWVRKL